MPTGNAIDITSLWTDPFWSWHILSSIVLWAALLVMSHLSVRLLYRLPHFEHKDEMLWGARWWMLILFAIVILLPGAIWYVNIRLTGRVWLLSIWIPWAAVLIAMHYGLGSWTLRGPSAILTYWQLKRKKETVELADLLEKWEERVIAQQRTKRTGLIIFAVLLAVMFLIHVMIGVR